MNTKNRASELDKKIYDTHYSFNSDDSDSRFLWCAKLSFQASNSIEPHWANDKFNRWVLMGSIFVKIVSFSLKQEWPSAFVSLVFTRSISLYLSCLTCTCSTLCHASVFISRLGLDIITGAFSSLSKWGTYAKFVCWCPNNFYRNKTEYDYHHYYLTTGVLENIRCWTTLLIITLLDLTIYGILQMTRTPRVQIFPGAALRM